MRERFWTTTYLESEFWAGNDPQILEANQVLAERLVPKRVRKGAARSRLRRFVLLHRQITEELSYQRRRFHSAREIGIVEFEEERRDYERRANGFRQLEKLGFEVSVVYDRNGTHQHLPPAINFHEWVTEIALYDTSRIDIFQGLNELSTLPVNYATFKAVRDQVEQWMSGLADAARVESLPFHEFDEKMKEMISTNGSESTTSHIGFLGTTA